jgi:hypothetical protein
LISSVNAIDHKDVLFFTVASHLLWLILHELSTDSERSLDSSVTGCIYAVNMVQNCPSFWQHMVCVEGRVNFRPSQVSEVLQSTFLFELSCYHLIVIIE